MRGHIIILSMIQLINQSQVANDQLWTCHLCRLQAYIQSYICAVGPRYIISMLTFFYILLFYTPKSLFEIIVKIIEVMVYYDKWVLNLQWSFGCLLVFTDICMSSILLGFHYALDYSSINTTAPQQFYSPARNVAIDTVYDKTFKGENFHGFHSFSLNHKAIPINYGLVDW